MLILKKTLALAIILILLMVFPFSSFAQEEVHYHLSEDLQTLNCSDGFSYQPVDMNKANCDGEYTELSEKEIWLHHSVHGKPTGIIGEFYKDQYYITLSITFENGSSYFGSYLREDYIEIYQSLLSDPPHSLMVEFDFPEENALSTSYALLKGQPCSLSSQELEWSEYFYCYATDPKLSIKVQKGAVLKVKDQFYFADFSEIPMEDPSWFSPYEYESLDAYKITDSDLLAKLKNGYSKNKFGDLAGFGDQDMLEIIYWFLLATLLFFLPLAGLILCIIFALRSANYRKAFLFGSIGLAAELIGFLIFILLKIL